MTSVVVVVFLGLALGLALGAAHSLALRYLSYRLVAGPAAFLPALFITLALRILPVLALVGTLVLWGVAPVVSGLTGYWIGRNLVVALSLRRG